jgi:hypothetical protein
MRIGSFMAAAGFLALAACGSGDKADGNGTAARAVAGGQVKLQPGEWEMTMETVNVDAPGLPAAVVASMKQPRATSRSCITPEEANGPKSDMFAGNVGANCKQEGFSWTGGHIKGKTTCAGAKGQGKMSMEVDGQYGGQTMDMNMKMTTAAAGTPMTVETHMAGRRIGECPAGKTG